MAYAPPHRTPLAEAAARKRRTAPGYDRTVRVLPAAQRDLIYAYVQAIHAEAAAQRNEANRLRAALDSRTRGDHHNENGATP